MRSSVEHDAETRLRRCCTCTACLVHRLHCNAFGSLEGARHTAAASHSSAEDLEVSSCCLWLLLDPATMTK